MSDKSHTFSLHVQGMHCAACEVLVERELKKVKGVEKVKEDVRKDYTEIGAAVLIVIGAYLILKQFNLIPQGLGLDSQMSYGFVFLIGLVAAVSSCLAVTGGLLLAVAAKYN